MTSATAAALTAHSVLNLGLVRGPHAASPPGATDTVVRERLSVLVPMRDEAHRLEPGLRSVLAAVAAYGNAAELLVLDDCSTDGTRALVDALVAHASPGTRVRVLDGAPPPSGWLGKAWACAQLAEAADPTSTVLALVDADVHLEPHGLTAAVDLLRRHRLDLVSPWPRQVAGSWSERLVQPLQQWSWLTTVPLRLAERSSRPAFAAANGQLVVVDRAAYDRAGGHHAVRDEVLDDIGLLRAVLRSGGHGVPVDGTSLASCRMYRGWADVRDGYTKSLWAAFGSRAGAIAVVGGLGLVYLWPLSAALAGSPVGAAGYAAAVLGRAAVARKTGAKVWPDSLAHPASVVLLGWLTARSWAGRHRGTLTWKGRRIAADGGAETD
ncbi:MAG TPA: glycosyltransferase family 2 protein [Actinomycetales bacterium]|nr:glycosyltransferase family 2 protein [Actinomycetales bacterium]